MRVDIASRRIRRKRYYYVEEAGAQVDLTRSQSYRAVHSGEIPVERHGRFFLGPRQKWDAKVKRLLRKPAPHRRKAAAEAAIG